MRKNSTDRQLDQKVYPKAREDNLLATSVGDETVIYDQLTNEASCLNTVTATVWAACDGENTLSDLLDIVRQAGFQDASEDLVILAINELAEARFLQETPQASSSKKRDKSRRDVLRTLGKSAAIAIPVISTISIQPAVAGLSPIPCSPNGSPCGIGGTCVGGFCIEP
jgi:hypothetical protein